MTPTPLQIVNDIDAAIHNLRALGQEPTMIRMSEEIYNRLLSIKGHPIPGNSHQRRVYKRRIARLRKMMRPEPELFNMPIYIQ